MLVVQWVSMRAYALLGKLSQAKYSVKWTDLSSRVACHFYGNESRNASCVLFLNVNWLYMCGISLSNGI